MSYDLRFFKRAVHEAVDIDYGVTFFWPESEAVRVLDVAVTGSENAFAVIQTLHERTGWRAADEVEIDFNGDPASGLRYWAGTLDTLRRQVGSNKKNWWQFWK